MYQLLQMDPGERQGFLDAIEAIAASDERDGRKDRAAWVRSIPVTFGVQAE
nr:hypothetical protein GCM10020063_102240 [Dactylosporangium thailandense]